MKKKQIIFIGIILIIIFAVFKIYYSYVITYVSNWQTRGQIGDTFGSVNALFSSLAFVGIVFTLFQQNDLINQSRIDTANSMKEFNESVIQFKQQQKIQALNNLISIYEKRLHYYKSVNETALIIITEKKLVDLIAELELYLTK